MAVIKKMQWEIDNLKRKLSGKYFDNSKLKAFQSRSFQPNRSDILCYNCNQNGHVAKFCRNRSFCLKCNLGGHSLRNCRQNQKLRNFHSDDFGDESQPDKLDLDDEKKVRHQSLSLIHI